MSMADRKFLAFLNRCINSGSLNASIPDGLLESASVPAVEKALRLLRRARAR